jgi:hypothetical protein
VSKPSSALLVLPSHFIASHKRWGWIADFASLAGIAPAQFSQTRTFSSTVANLSPLADVIRRGMFSVLASNTSCAEKSEDGLEKRLANL